MTRLCFASSILFFAVQFSALHGQEFGTAEAPISLWPSVPPGDENLSLPEEKNATTDKDGLVDGREVIRLVNVANPTLTIYRPSNKTSDAIVVILPGGGHRVLAYDLEGTEVAEWLAQNGVTAALVKYRVPARDPKDRVAAAAQDAQRAVSMVRSMSRELGISKDSVGILGFSAGGETAVMSTYQKQRRYEALDAKDEFDWQANFVILAYPAYLIDKQTNQLRSDIEITTESPPAFVVHAVNDPVTAKSSLLFANAMLDAKVSVELHVYDRGGHGYGLRKTENPVTQWPEVCNVWMELNGWMRKSN